MIFTKKIIKKNNLLNVNNLSKENFFVSLLGECYKKQVLNSEEIQSINLATISILQDEIEKFTLGESSSVKVEVAEKIMLSIQYILGIYFKNIKDINGNVNLLKSNNIKDLYKEGKVLVDKMINDSKEILQKVKHNRMTIDNYAYNDTLDYGIPIFFKEYDEHYASHEIPGSIDYPLYNLDYNLTGIEYINDYLNKLYLENQFCKVFDSNNIDSILRGYDKESNQLLINVFTIFLLNSVCAKLCGKSASDILINKGDIIITKQKLESHKDNLNDLLKCTCVSICKEISISNQKLAEYMISGIDDLVIWIKEALKNNKLESVFIIAKENEENQKIAFIDGSKIDDDTFRAIFYDIRDCINTPDKINIIKSKISSLEDLIDILDSECIAMEEYYEIFDALNSMELALICNYVMLPDNDESFEGNDKEWHKELYDYLYNKENKRKTEILFIRERLK